MGGFYYVCGSCKKVVKLEYPTEELADGKAEQIGWVLRVDPQEIWWLCNRCQAIEAAEPGYS